MVDDDRRLRLCDDAPECTWCRMWSPIPGARRRRVACRLYRGGRLRTSRRSKHYHHCAATRGLRTKAVLRAAGRATGAIVERRRNLRSGGRMWREVVGRGHSTDLTSVPANCPQLAGVEFPEMQVLRDLLKRAVFQTEPRCQSTSEWLESLAANISAQVRTDVLACPRTTSTLFLSDMHARPRAHRGARGALAACTRR